MKKAVMAAYIVIVVLVYIMLFTWIRADQLGKKIREMKEEERAWKEKSRALEKSMHIKTTNGWEVGGLCQRCRAREECPFRKEIDRRGHRITDCDLYIEGKVE